MHDTIYRLQYITGAFLENKCGVSEVLHNRFPSSDRLPLTWPARISQLDFFGDFRDISRGNNFLNSPELFQEVFHGFQGANFLRPFLSPFETAFRGIKPV